MKAKKQKDLSKQVMAEIHQKEIKMRPKIYFVAGSFLLGIGMAGLLVLATFFTHLVLFHLRTHAPFAFLRLGRFGLQGFLVNFPWLPLFLSLAGLAGGALMLRRFDFSYKKSFGGLVIGLVALVLTLGFLADRARLEGPMKRLPPVQPLYQGRFKGGDWVVGKVLEIVENQMTIQTPEGKETKVVWDEKTRLPLGGAFEEGNTVRAVGEWQEGILKAKGILQHEGLKEPGPGFGPGKVKGRLHFR